MTEQIEEERSRSRIRWVGAVTGIVVTIAVLAAALVPVFLSPTQQPSDRPSTPSADIEFGEGEARFTGQTVTWYDCGGGMECADVASPLDWENLDGEVISLHMTRQPALSGQPIGSLFVNPGGPGASGASFVAESIDFAVGQNLQQHFDVIGWDPRGVGSSSAVTCFTGEEMDDWLFGDPREYIGLDVGSDEWLEVAQSESEKRGEACLQSTGPLLEFVDTESTVQDLNLLRELVGDDTLNYLGFSYGTYIGSRYADLFPDRVGRVVLDGALAPDASMHEVVLEQTKGFEAATRAYLADCLAGSDCPFTGTVDHAMEEIKSIIQSLESSPQQGSDGRWVSSGTFLTAIITPLYSQESWSYLSYLFATAQAGDFDTALVLADFYYSRTGRGEYSDNSTEAFWAINCLDYPSQGDPEVMRQQAAELERVAPTFGEFQGYGDVSCSGWPFPGDEDRGPVAGVGAAPILVIGTTGDPATPYVWAEDLAEQLESGVLVTFEGEGHTAYGGTASECIASTVESYLLEGAVPPSDPRC